MIAFRSLDKFMKLEKETSADFDDELFDLLPINCNFFKYNFYSFQV